MKIRAFEDLIGWQKSQELAVFIYRLKVDIKDREFVSQYWRAVISISNNISEGFNRQSDAELRRFLFYSLGSCSELKSMTYLGGRVLLINKESKDKILKDVDEISRIIYGLIKSLK